MLVDLDPREPVFTIGVAAKLVGLSPKQLRLLEANEIVVPARSKGNRRLYSLDQLNILKYVSYLVGVRKVNVAGVRVALELFEALPEDARTQALEPAQASVAGPTEPDFAPLLDEVPGSEDGGMSSQ